MIPPKKTTKKQQQPKNLKSGQFSAVGVHRLKIPRQWSILSSARVLYSRHRTKELTVRLVRAESPQLFAFFRKLNNSSADLPLWGGGGGTSTWENELV